jgi:hypothetical protein
VIQAFSLMELLRLIEVQIMLCSAHPSVGWERLKQYVLRNTVIKAQHIALPL